MSNFMEEDILYIDEVVQFTPPASPKVTWKIKPKQPEVPINEDDQEQKPKPIPRLTPQTKPKLTQPAIINGKLVTNLEVLSPTTTLSELRMRQANSYQRFHTRKGEDIYLDRDIINRIKFEEIQQKKGREQTINLPSQHQVRLKVKMNGDIVFHHYRRRGISKFKKAQVEPNCSTGEENVQS